LQDLRYQGSAAGYQLAGAAGWGGAKILHDVDRLSTRQAVRALC